MSDRVTTPPTESVAEANLATQVIPSRLRRGLNALPDLLTTARLVLAVSFPWVPGAWRAPWIAMAAASDFFDGFLSRRLGVSTTYGQVLDPIADKLFMFTVLTTLWLAGPLEAWQVVLVAARDLCVIGGSSWSVAREGWTALASMPPSWLGKMTTALQFLLILITVLDASWITPVFVPTVLFSVLAGADYLRRRSR